MQCDFRLERVFNLKLYIQLWDWRLFLNLLEYLHYPAPLIFSLQSYNNMQSSVQTRILIYLYYDLFASSEQSFHLLIANYAL